jgi:hypothetical protein
MCSALEMAVNQLKHLYQASVSKRGDQVHDSDTCSYIAQTYSTLGAQVVNSLMTLAEILRACLQYQRHGPDAP